jgi:hypothetical protein
MGGLEVELCDELALDRAHISWQLYGEKLGSANVDQRCFVQ